MEVSGQLHPPSALPLGETAPIPIGQEIGWASRADLDAVVKRTNPLQTPAGNRIPVTFLYLLIILQCIDNCRYVCFGT